MVGEKRDCSFCGQPIEPGTGKLYIRRDGTKLWFDQMKCQKNMLGLKRVNRKIKWTRAYVKGQGRVGAAAGGPDSKAPGAVTAPAVEKAKKPKGGKRARTATK